MLLSPNSGSRENVSYFRLIWCSPLVYLISHYRNLLLDLLSHTALSLDQFRNNDQWFVVVVICDCLVWQIPCSRHRLYKFQYLLHRNHGHRVQTLIAARPLSTLFIPIGVVLCCRNTFEIKFYRIDCFYSSLVCVWSLKYFTYLYDTHIDSSGKPDFRTGVTLCGLWGWLCLSVVLPKFSFECFRDASETLLELFLGYWFI